MHILSTPLDSKHHMEIVSNVWIHNYMYFQENPLIFQQPTNRVVVATKENDICCSLVLIKTTKWYDIA